MNRNGQPGKQRRSGRGLWCALLLALLGTGCGLEHPQKLYSEALAAERENRAADAQKLYQRVLARDPNHAPAIAAYGSLLLRLGQSDAAEATLQRGAALFPERLSMVVPLARLHLARHRTAEAESLLIPWNRVDSPPVEISLLQADLAWQKKDAAGARGILEGLLEKKPSRAANDVRLKLAAISLIEGSRAEDSKRAMKLDEAAHHLRAVLDSSPGQPEAETGLGCVLLAQGKPAEARNHFSSAWADGARPPTAAAGLILCALRERDLDRAIEAAGDFSAAYPAELNAVVMRAELAAAAGRGDVLASIELPESAGSLKQYVDGLRHIAEGQYFDSYPLLTSIAREWEDYGPAQLFAGAVARELNDRSQALEFFKNAREHLPPDPALAAVSVRMALAQSETGYATEELKKLAGGSTAFSSIRIESKFRQGDYQAALAEAGKWRAANPGLPGPLAAAADIQDALGSGNEALQLWKQVMASGDGLDQNWAALRVAWSEQDWRRAHAALDRMTDRTDRVSLEILRGQIEMVRGAADEARVRFESAVMEDSRNAAAHAWLGLWQVLKRHIAAAHRSFERALGLNPHEPVALWGEGFIALLDKNHPRAETYFRASLDANPGFELARWTLAETLLAQGKSREALATAREIGGALKESPAVLDLLGRAMILEKNWDQAAAHWKQFQQRYPKSPVSYFYQAQIQFILGDKKAARRTVEEGLKLIPDDPRLKLAQADLLWDEGKSEEALLLVSQLSRNADDYEASVLQAALHLRRSHHSKASSILKELLGTHPDDARLYSLLCVAQLGLKKPEEALLTLRTGWLRLPQEVLLGFRLAELQEQSRQPPEAISTYREILKIHPGHPRALNQLAWRLAEQGSLDEALQFAEEACKARAEDPAAFDTRAYILYLKEDYPVARKQLEELMKLAPENPYVRYHWGLALWKTGDAPGAREVLEKVLVQQPDFAEAEKIKETLKKI